MAISYPLINGVLYSFPSIELVANGQQFMGFKSINYSMKRSRTMVYGASPDPLGKTVGKMAYTCEADVYLAEWNQFLSQLGSGFGDVFFQIVVSYNSPSQVTFQDSIVGCTLDELDASQAEGTEALSRKLSFAPLKIYPNGFECLQVPLVGLQASILGVNIQAAVGGSISV